jgi:hypothetical protein
MYGLMTDEERRADADRRLQHCEGSILAFIATGDLHRARLMLGMAKDAVVPDASPRARNSFHITTRGVA